MSPGRWRRLLCLSLVLLWTPTALARTVAIVRTEGDEEVVETINRIHGELLAVGFQVVWARGAAQVTDTPEENPDRQRQLSVAGGLDADVQLDAAIEIVSDGPPFEIAVWLLEPGTPPKLIRVEPAGPERAPDKVAIRAVEALRSALLEGDLVVPEPVANPAPTRDVPEVPPSRSESVGLAAGAATLTGLDGVGPALLPWLEVHYAVQRDLLLKATGAGFGTRPTVTSSADRARLAQDFALLGAAYRIGTFWRLQPFVALSAGILKTRIEGTAFGPGRAHTETQYSFLTQGSLGLDIRLPGPYFTSLAGHVHLARPSIAVHLRDTVAATTGEPNLALGLTAGVWL